MKASPLWGYVLLKPTKLTRKTKSGLDMPDSAQGRIRYGKVVEVGFGHLTFNGNLSPMRIDVNDTIAYKASEAEDIALDTETYVIVDQRNIVAILS